MHRSLRSSLVGAACAALALSLGAPLSAHAQRGAPDGPQRGGGARLEQLLRRRLGLDDQQVARLRATSRSYAPQRMALARREGAIADSLLLLVTDDRRDEAAVSRLLDSLWATRRSRLALREREQRDRAAFLTPSQRAMLLGVEEQGQRRAADFRARREVVRP